MNLILLDIKLVNGPSLSCNALKAYIDKYYDGTTKLSTRVIEMTCEAEANEIYATILSKKPQIIGYSCYFWNFTKIIEIIKLLKQHGDFIHILGGPEICAERLPAIIKQDIADYYVVGEGERTLLKLIKYLDKGKTGNYSGLPCGVATADNKKIIYSPNLDTIDNLEEIPSIFLGKNAKKQLSFERASVETQRGCVFKCTYCQYGRSFDRIRYFPLNRIFNELKLLASRQNIKFIHIIDPSFTSDINRAKKIIKYLINLKNQSKKNLPVIWLEYNHNMIDDEFLHLTSLLNKKNGISSLGSLDPEDNFQLPKMIKDYGILASVGIQSFCLEALKAVNRAEFNCEQFTHFWNSVKKNNLCIKIDILLGLPLETFSSYFEGLELVLSLLKGTDHVLIILLLSILPGSELKKKCSEYNIKYLEKAPHFVVSSNGFFESELQYTCKLTAILSRIINSPFRSTFLRTKETSKKTLIQLLEDIFCKIISMKNKKNFSTLLHNDSLDDSYWLSDDAFKEMPSDMIKTILSDDRVKKSFSGKDARKYQRINTSRQAVIRSLKQTSMSEDARTRNICEDGMCIIANNEYEIGSSFSLECFLSENSTAILIQAMVIWERSIFISFNAQKPMYLLGLKFIKIKGPVAAKLRDYVKNQPEKAYLKNLSNHFLNNIS